MVVIVVLTGAGIGVGIVVVIVVGIGAGIGVGIDIGCGTSWVIVVTGLDSTWKFWTSYWTGEDIVSNCVWGTLVICVVCGTFAASIWGKTSGW